MTLVNVKSVLALRNLVKEKCLGNALSVLTAWVSTAELRYYVTVSGTPWDKNVLLDALAVLCSHKGVTADTPRLNQRVKRAVCITAKHCLLMHPVMF
jgi:hypothetical protein